MPANQTIAISVAQNEGRCIIFKSDADLSAYDPAKIQTWVFEARPYNAGSRLRTLEKVRSVPGSAAYVDEYPLRFCETHCAALTAPDGQRNDAPRPADFEALNPIIVGAFVFRAENSTYGFSEADYDAIKKSQTPGGDANG